jgi:hypothetical protein
VIDFVVVIAVLFVVVLVVSAPLRRARRPYSEESGELADLEAAREAKYREIRDAELDHRTGKLSDADYELLDRNLRAEAIEILRSIDGERGRPAQPSNGAGPPATPPSRTSAE